LGATNGRGKEEREMVNIIIMFFLHTHENSIMKPTKTVIKGGRRIKKVMEG
jgi:hypothetical protein